MPGILMIEKRTDTRGMQTQKEDHVRTQGKGSYLQAKEGGLKKNQSLHLGLLVSRTVRQYISGV